MKGAARVTTFEQNYRENGADKQNDAEAADHDKEPGLFDAQVAIAIHLDVFDVIGANTWRVIAHIGRVAGLGEIVARQNEIGALWQQKGGQRWRWNRQNCIRWLNVNAVETSARVLRE